MSKLKSYHEQIQETIDKGINKVEEQYKTLVARPFSLAEKVESEARNLSVNQLREKHDKAVDGLYDSLRAFNKKVNGYVAEVIAKLEGAPEQESEAKPAKAVAKKASATKAKAEEKKEALAGTA